MAMILGLALAGLAVWLVTRRGDRPRELDADVWDADPEVSAANLRAKTAAWEAGERWFSPRELARVEGAKAVAASLDNLPASLRAVTPAVPERRLVRPTPMHRPLLE